MDDTTSPMKRKELKVIVSSSGTEARRQVSRSKKKLINAARFGDNAQLCNNEKKSPFSSGAENGNGKPFDICKLSVATEIKDSEEYFKEIKIDLDDSFNNTPNITRCEICGKNFKNKKSLKSHRMIHSGTKRFSCTLCGETFSRRGNLNRHLGNHSEERKYKCDMCGKAFKRPATLKGHLGLHSEIPLYFCDLCGKGFHQRIGLLNHKAAHEEVANAFMCDICGKGFSFLSRCKTHMAFHSDERLYSCEFCQKRFYLRTHLNRHVRSIHGDMNFSCDKCSKVFSSCAALKRHKENKHMSRFFCDVCGAGFMRKLYLQKHRVTHETDNNDNTSIEKPIEMKVKPRIVTYDLEPIMSNTDSISYKLTLCEDNPDEKETITMTHSDTIVPIYLSDGETVISGNEILFDESQAVSLDSASVLGLKISSGGLTQIIITQQPLNGDVIFS